MFSNLKVALRAAMIVLALPLLAAWSSATEYQTLHPNEPALAPDMARIYFYREGGLLGAAVQPVIKVDGVKTGHDSSPGDYFYLDKPAGTYKVSTSTEKDESVDVTVAAGQSVYVRFHVSMGFFVGHVSPEVVDPARGEAEIKDCDYDGTPPAAAPPATTPPPAMTPPAATPPAPAPAATPSTTP